MKKKRAPAVAAPELPVATTPARPGRGPWIAALVAALCYLPALWNDFTYDDLAIVRENPRIRSLDQLGAIWSSDWWQPTAEDAARAIEQRRDRLYRPLSMTTFALNYAVHGLHPAGYLLVNLALHALAAALVWRLALRLLGDPAVAGVAALLFAVHPVHAEAVANVVGRAELLGAVFLMLGLLTVRPAGGSPGLGRAALASVLLFAALAAKESAICYPALVALLLYADRGWRTQATWRLTLQAALLLAPAALYLSLRYAALDGHLVRIAPPTFHMNPLVGATGAERVVGVLTIIGHYVRLLLVPAQLAADYGYAVIVPSRVPGGYALVGLLVVVAGGVGLLGFRRATGVWRQVALLTGLLVASYLLISNAVLTIGVSLAERLMYWPSAPALMLVALAVVAAWRRWFMPGGRARESARVVYLGGLALLVVLGLRGTLRATDWASNRVLFEADARTVPQSVQVRRMYAAALLDELPLLATPQARAAQMEEARTQLDAALAIYPAYIEGMHLRGVVAYLAGDYPSAETYLERAAQLGPIEERARQLLAEVRGAGRAAEIEAVRQQLARDPDNAALHLALGELLIETGQYRAALDAAEQAIRRAPDDVQAVRLLARALLVNDDPPRAVQTLRRLLEMDPDDWMAHTNLATIISQSDPPAALRHARRAAELAPDRLEARQNLAEVLAANKEIDAAIRELRVVLSGMAEDDPLRAAVAYRIGELERLRR
jgi:tetratricopeptide (TPR) repeat protein